MPLHLRGSENAEKVSPKLADFLTVFLTVFWGNF
jgi:hypothetical protein